MRRFLIVTAGQNISFSSLMMSFENRQMSICQLIASPLRKLSFDLPTIYCLLESLELTSFQLIDQKTSSEATEQK